MMPRRLTVAIAIILILAGLGTYYAIVQSGPQGSVTEAIAIVAPSDVAAAELSPQNFTVTEGEKVTLVIDNMDNTTHTLAIPTIMETPVIQPGQTVIVSFVPKEVGVFPLMQPVIMQCQTYHACYLTGGYVTVIAR
jgi:nitrous oxide reductase